jgi:hypothetical protein
MTDAADERAALNAFLHAQRRSVLAIIAGLDEGDLRRPVVSSGWCPLGLIEHLTDAERFWFERVVNATGNPLADRPSTGTGPTDGPFAARRRVHEVLACYREQAARSDKSSPARHWTAALPDAYHRTWLTRSTPCEMSSCT